MSYNYSDIRKKENRDKKRQKDKKFSDHGKGKWENNVIKQAQNPSKRTRELVIGKKIPKKKK